MNISPKSIPSASASASSCQQPNQASNTQGPEAVDDGAGGKHAHRSHRGGHMREALMQALQNLGLSAPAQASAAPAASSARSQSSTDGDEDPDDAGAVSNVKGDMRQFMRALFQAVKSEDGSESSAKGSQAADGRENFSDGLAALIAQVSGGSAPSALQDAFSKLVTDLQSTNAGATSSTDAAAGATKPQVTLQALLTQLQQAVGYGVASTAPSGNLVSTVA